MGLLFILALLGGSPIIALIFLCAIWMNASAKDDLARERRLLADEERRHRELMLCIDEAESRMKTKKTRKRRVRTIKHYPDGTVKGQEMSEIIRQELIP